MIFSRIACAAALILAGAVSASAQTANAHAPSDAPSGSQVPQFPSAGVPPAGGTGGGAAQIGPPTALERQEQQKSNDAMTICKGC